MKPPKTLTYAETEQLLAFRLSARERLLILIMLDAGLRVGETVKLTLENCYYVANPVTILDLPGSITKNHRPRSIPLSRRLADCFGEFLIWWKKSHAVTGAGFLFTTNSNLTHLSTRQAQRIVRNLGLKSINRIITPHMLRHTFATRLMRKSNARVVQTLLGHSSLSSTQIYMHPNGDDLRCAIDLI